MTPALQLVSDNTVGLNLERARLRGIMREIHWLGGWPELMRILQDEKAALAAQLREEIADEGWIG